MLCSCLRVVEMRWTATMARKRRKRAKSDSLARFREVKSAELWKLLISEEAMAILSEGAKARVGTLINVAKTAFHWGFMPTVLYLGFQKGSYLLIYLFLFLKLKNYPVQALNLECLSWPWLACSGPRLGYFCDTPSKRPFNKILIEMLWKVAFSVLVSNSLCSLSRSRVRMNYCWRKCFECDGSLSDCCQYLLGFDE